MDKREYSFTLRNDKVSFYNRISWLIIIVNYLFLLYLGLFAAEKELRMKSIASLITSVLILGLYFFLRKRKYAISLYWVFMSLIIAWILIEYYWIAVLMLVFNFLNLLANKKPIVTFSTEKIKYPSFFYRNLDWKELNNTMLKDGLLTIDFKNNKLIQQLIIDENVNEKDFNDFCKEQLEYSLMDRNR